MFYSLLDHLTSYLDLRLELEKSQLELEFLGFGMNAAAVVSGIFGALTALDRVFRSQLTPPFIMEELMFAWKSAYFGRSSCLLHCDRSKTGL